MIERASARQAGVRRGGSVDEADVASFDRLGAEWWRPDGPMKALHKFNPVRVTYIRDQLLRHFDKSEGQRGLPLAGLSLLDIGCGGGLLAESLAALGADVVAIDPAPGNIDIARTHAEASGLNIDYRCVRVEDLATEGRLFDAVLTMEVIEHVRNARAFLRHAASLTRPGGLLFAATLNRTLKSYAFAIVGAEYVLRWVARGTHDWQKFVTPQELSAMLTAAGLRVFDKTGVVYEPLRDRWRLSSDMDINYMMVAKKLPIKS
jgi:2-polyprenyl-6-hydroxyphenyl methylase/3-demethylubiquinone-9 3-methyltransferase